MCGISTEQAGIDAQPELVWCGPCSVACKPPKLAEALHTLCMMQLVLPVQSCCSCCCYSSCGVVVDIVDDELSVGLTSEESCKLVLANGVGNGTMPRFSRADLVAADAVSWHLAQLLLTDNTQISRWNAVTYCV